MYQEPLEHNIENLKGVLPSLGKEWMEDSSDELAQKIRHYEAIINFDPDNCDDARKLLREALYEATFFKPWEIQVPPAYVEYKVIEHKEPPPYVEYQLIPMEKVIEEVRPDGRVELGGGDILALPCFGIQLLVNTTGGTGRVLQSYLTDDISLEEDDRYVAALRAIEIMILSHALYGIDVCSEDYCYGVEAAVEECGELYG